MFVGNIYNNSENTTTIISKTDSGYGLQNEKAIGWTTYGTEYVGVIAFSDIKYWVDSSNNLLSKYGTSYPANVFDSNSNLYEPLENYKTYLKNTLGKTSVKISLLSYEQAMSLGCNTSNRCYSSPNWLHSTTYWTLSARDENGIWILYSDGDFYDYGFSKDNVRGLRPVITINKSDL